MIIAARELFREQGYLGTSFRDVLAESSAPRGSVYFHFPGGKEELGTEVAIAHAAATVADINRAAARATSGAELVRLIILGAGNYLAKSGYRKGCAVTPIVVDVGSSSPALVEVVRRGFEDSISTLAARLVDKGIPGGRARRLAVSALAGMEGALIVARASRSTEAFESLAEDIAELAESAEAANSNHSPRLGRE
jgi:AcrR family transcriptional regulator